MRLLPVRAAVLLLPLLLAAGQLPAAEPPRTPGEALGFEEILPRRSDVSFSSRWKRPANASDPHDTFAAARSFHATRLDWVYTVDPAFIGEACDRGLPLVATLNACLPDHGASTYSEGRMRDAAGAMIVAPWMTWTPEPYMGCVNTAEYFENMLARSIRMIEAGAAGTQYDDPEQNINALNWGGCHCDACTPKFAAYLDNSLGAEERVELGVDLDGFEYRAFLQAGGEDDALAGHFRDFQRLSVEGFQSRLHHAVEAHFGRRIPFSSNNFDILWHSPFHLFDYGMCELPKRSQDPATIFERLQEAVALGRAQIVTIHSDEHLPTRRMIGMIAASGGVPLVPWDVWMEGSRRYFGTPEEYADLYGFIRAAAPELMDGYRAAASHIPTDLAAGEAESTEGLALDNPRVAAVLERRADGAAGPVVVHLVDWSEEPGAFDLRIDGALLGGSVRSATLAYPAAYIQAEHEHAADTGDYRMLRRDLPLAHAESEGVAAFRIPRLDPWAILVLHIE